VRARELHDVFVAHDADHDGSLDLKELTRIVHNIDACRTALPLTHEPLKEPRGDSELARIYTQVCSDGCVTRAPSYPLRSHCGGEDGPSREFPARTHA
jgi:Ca2+-binding EF-hand superfamily protein